MCFWVFFSNISIIGFTFFKSGFVGVSFLTMDIYFFGVSFAGLRNLRGFWWLGGVFTQLLRNDFVFISCIDISSVGLITRSG